MRLAPRETLAARHGKLREAVNAADLDSLVVTHLPNVFYLTNFQGTAGVAVVTRERLYLILDFRYSAAASALWDTPHGCPDAEIVPVDRTYDETLTVLIKKLQLQRLGIEGAYVSVNRAHDLAKSLDATVQAGSGVIFEERGSNAARPVSVVATDGLVEQLRIVKDAHEIEMLRRGGELLSSVAVDVLGEIKAGIPSHATVDLTAPPQWNDAEIRERMSGNLCRCGAYVGICSAIRRVHDARRG